MKKNKPKKEKLTEIIKVRVTPELYNFVKFVGEIHGTDVSKMIREALISYRDIYIEKLKKEKFSNYENI